MVSNNITEVMWKRYFIEETDMTEIRHVFEKSYKSRKIPDLINSLLQFISDHSVDIDLPEEVLERFAFYCQNLPISQPEKLWQCLMLNISLSLQRKMYTGLQTPIKLLTRLLMNMKISEHNFEKVKILMDQLAQNCLSLLLNLCTTKCKIPLSFDVILTLVYVWGELNFILQQYFLENFDEGNMQTVAFNLSHLHYYFDDWKTIHSKVKESDNRTLYVYALLVLQKFRSAKLSLCTIDKIAVSDEYLKSIASLLFDLALKSIVEDDIKDNVWLLLLTHLPVLIKYWEEEIVFNVIRQIIGIYCSDNHFLLKDEMKKIITSERFIEEKHFQSMFICIFWEKIFSLPSLSISVFEKLSINFNKEKSSFESFTDIGEELNKLLNENNQSEIDIYLTEQHIKSLELIRLEYLSSIDKTKCALGVCILLNKWKVIDCKFSEVWNLISRCYRVIIATLNEDYRLSSYITSGNLLCWFFKFQTKICKLEEAEDQFDDHTDIVETIFLDLLTNYFYDNSNIPDFSSFLNELMKISNVKERKKMSRCQLKNYAIFIHATLKFFLEKLTANLETTAVIRFEKIVKSLVSLLKQLLTDKEIYPYIINSLEVIDKTKYYQDVEERCSNLLQITLEDLKNCQDENKIITYLQQILWSAVKIPHLQFNIWLKIKSLYIKVELNQESNKIETLSHILENFVTSVEKDVLCDVFNDLLREMAIIELTQETVTSAISCLKLWSFLIGEKEFNSEKTQLLLDNLNELLICCLHLIQKPPINLKWITIPSVLNVVEKILLRTNSCRLECTLVNLCAHVCISILTLPRGRLKMEDFSTIFTGLCSVMNSISAQPISIVDSLLTVLISCCNRLINFLLEYSDQSQVESIELELPFLEECAQNLRRLLFRLCDRSKHKPRLAPYVVAEYITRSQQFAILPTIKMKVIEGIYRFMDSCDEHSINLLQNNLSPSGKETFKLFLLDYKTLHKYTGRV